MKRKQMNEANQWFKAVAVGNADELKDVLTTYNFYVNGELVNSCLSKFLRLEALENCKLFAHEEICSGTLRTGTCICKKGDVIN